MPQAAALIGARVCAGGDDAAAPGSADEITTPGADGGSAWLCVGALPLVDDGALVLAGRQPALVASADLRRVELADVARRWHGLGCPPAWPTAADFTPPFALAVLARRRSSVRIVTGAIGLSHVYVAWRGGLPVASSSALACARSAAASMPMRCSAWRKPDR